MGLAYGATEPGATGGAKRVGAIIGPDGRVLRWQAAVSSKSFPAEALAALGG